MTRLSVGSRMADIFKPASWQSCLGCGRLVAGANRCEDCQRAARRAYDSTRPDHHRLYQSPEWRKLSADVRDGASRCFWCLKPTRRLVADHERPVGPDTTEAEFLDRDAKLPDLAPEAT